jgi:ABC-type sugar transport system substrate-binding protein
MKTRIGLILLIPLALAACGTPTPVVIKRTTVVTATPSPATPSPPTPVTPYTCAPDCTYEDMTVAFIQTGSRGGWAAANTASFRETAEELGITLKFYNAQKVVENQLSAFRDFIADEEVDVIVLAPLEPTGYDEVLQEARDAGKIVIVEDRHVDASEDLYATHVGSDFVEEGRKAGREMIKLLADGQSKNVVELVGIGDSPVTVARGRGFREAIEGSEIEIVRSQAAGWSEVKARQVMAAWLSEDVDIQAVFAQSDEMALGAIEAIYEAGLQPGEDIKIITIGATYITVGPMIDGDLNVAVECSPDLAPQVYEAALKALNGEELPRWIPGQEGIFYPEDVQDFWAHYNY